MPREESGNVTMYELLRLTHAYQMSPVEKLFRFEYHDPGLLSETVGDFLCGIYDPGLYTGQLRLREADRTLDTMSPNFEAFLHCWEEWRTLSMISGLCREDSH